MSVFVRIYHARALLTKMQWLKKQSYLDDLESLDRELYQGLLFVKHHPENLEDLTLTFTIAEEGLLRRPVIISMFRTFPDLPVT